MPRNIDKIVPVPLPDPFHPPILFFVVFADQIDIASYNGTDSLSFCSQALDNPSVLQPANCSREAWRGNLGEQLTEFSDLPGTSAEADQDSLLECA